nr:hypothetical protein [Aurantimonas sp. VKM B-3413]
MFAVLPSGRADRSQQEPAGMPAMVEDVGDPIWFARSSDTGTGESTLLRDSGRIARTVKHPHDHHLAIIVHVVNGVLAFERHA